MYFLDVINSDCHYDCGMSSDRLQHSGRLKKIRQGTDGKLHHHFSNQDDKIYNVHSSLRFYTLSTVPVSHRHKNYTVIYSRSFGLSNNVLPFFPICHQLSIFSLPANEDLFLLPLSIFSCVFPFFSSLPIFK